MNELRLGLWHRYSCIKKLNYHMGSNHINAYFLLTMYKLIGN